MEIIIKPTAAEAQQEAANILRRQIQSKPASVLGLATGSTPIPVYAALVKMHEHGELDSTSTNTSASRRITCAPIASSCGSISSAR